MARAFGSAPARLPSPPQGASGGLGGVPAGARATCLGRSKREPPEVADSTAFCYAGIGTWLEPVSQHGQHSALQHPTLAHVTARLAALVGSALP